MGQALNNPVTPIVIGGLGLTPTGGTPAGVVPAVTQNVNQMELRGTIAPSGAAQVSILQFDFKRTKEAKEWVKGLNDAAWLLQTTIPAGATDDGTNEDEDLHDRNGFIWSSDAPGVRLGKAKQAFDLYTQQQSFVETVHLLINKADNTVTPGVGLTASEAFAWHSFMTLRYSNPQGYVRYSVPTEKNEIKPGPAVIGQQP